MRNLEQRSTIQDERLDKIESSLVSIIQLLSGLGLDSLPPKTLLVNVQHQHDQEKIEAGSSDHHDQQEGGPTKTPFQGIQFFQNSNFAKPGNTFCNDSNFTRNFKRQLAKIRVNFFKKPT